MFEDERDDDGSHRHSAAYLNSQGSLVIKIHDSGPVVERSFGMSEYESTETFSADQTARLQESLGDNLIAAIAQRFRRPGAVREALRVLGYRPRQGVEPHW
ncbi:hypothetical protein [Mycolicibacterium conceptionense]|uniref:hypothetical protein n=1 Tax=Mycolicibacterium conceptionense TaxID=451644 RepID=UPI00096CAC03|nr:hypothetical protein [Mycolicibacterium conceptionense]OMB80800.1 hypothetical protein A5743_09595 [Mycolicibacterium conceptionense]